MIVDWKKFDYYNKSGTAPIVGILVWIYEEFYFDVTVGYFDGTTFLTYSDSDDCHVTHWAEIERPKAPAESN